MNNRFIQYNQAGFRRTDYKHAFTKVWFGDPVNEYIYIIKDGLDKDLFPLKNLVVYFEYEVLYCQKLLNTSPKTESLKKVKELHYLMKTFGGTIQRGLMVDPDPTRKHTPDSKYWVRLYEYVNTCFSEEKEILRELVRMLRQKGFVLAYSKEQNKLRFYKPDNIDLVELKSLINLLGQYNEQFNNALFMIEDCSKRMLKNMAKGGVI